MQRVKILFYVTMICLGVHFSLFGSSNYESFSINHEAEKKEHDVDQSIITEVFIFFEELEAYIERREQEQKGYYLNVKLSKLRNMLEKARRQGSIADLLAARNVRGDTVLDYAFSLTRRQIARSEGYPYTFCALVLDYDPPLDIPNERGVYPLHKAVLLGKTDIILACFHADVLNKQDEKGNTPAHYARSIDILTFLQRAGADFTIKNDNERSPQDILAQKIASRLKAREDAMIDDDDECVERKFIVESVGFFCTTL